MIGVGEPRSLREPPLGIEREMRSLDPKLRLRWNPRIERWQVMRLRERIEKPRKVRQNEPWDADWWDYVVICNVENDDRSYRPPDARLIERIRAASRPIEQILADIDAYNAQRERDKNSAFSLISEQMARDIRNAIIERGVSSYEKANCPWMKHHMTKREKERLPIDFVQHDMKTGKFEKVEGFTQRV